MLYKPNYCCNCGERIERSEWRIWTSRRFCALCETEHKGADLFVRGAVGLGLLLGVFGFGSVLRNDQPQPEIVPARLSAKPVRPSSAQPPERQVSTPQTEQAAALAQPPANTNAVLEQPPQQRRTSEVTAYFCGATTKKGTPCSRRVKVRGQRCWQHVGADAPE